MRSSHPAFAPIHGQSGDFASQNPNVYVRTTHRSRLGSRPSRKDQQHHVRAIHERARQVVVLAQEEARTLKHNYIGTEHILLGLLREEEGLAARVLESLD